MQFLRCIWSVGTFVITIAFSLLNLAVSLTLGLLSIFVTIALKQ